LITCGAFTSIETESRRGLARPAHDRYVGRLAESDPIYAVIACRR
jgi:hypothetical protein